MEYSIRVFTKVNKVECSSYYGGLEGELFRELTSAKKKIVSKSNEISTQLKKLKVDHP